MVDTARSSDTGQYVHDDAHLESVVDAFGSVVQRNCEAVALQAGARCLTYGELDAATDRVAQQIQQLGLSHEECVAVAAERSIEAIIAFLGVLKAGGAYVPLDPRDPRTRLEFMLQDTGARMVLTAHAAAEVMRDLGPTVVPIETLVDASSSTSESTPGAVVNGSDLAYVMYTSGSTGRPKGVAIEHRGIVQRIRGAAAYMPRPGEAMLQVSALDFDAQTWEIWSALLNGARLVIAPPGRPDPATIGRLINDRGISVALLSPGLFHQMVESALEAIGELRLLLVGGDVMSPSHAQRFVERFPSRPLVNLYGPTEVTVCGTAHVVAPLEPGGRVPIGTPLGNTRLYVLDANGDEVALGARGELFIGGDCVARGYLNLPGPTRERFISDPFTDTPGARMYRTGDVARALPDGALEFLGRLDDQVKIRGFRVEPGEIESHLLAAPGVAQAAVVAREDVPGHTRLVAYIVPPPGGRVRAAEVREYLETRLPDHMVPSAFVTIDALPLTSRGKVDRKALPASTESDRLLTRPPRTEWERHIAAIWREVLHVDDIGVDDGFIELGGDSLLAVRVLVRLREEHDVELPLSAVFEEGTIERLARRADATARAHRPILPGIRRVGRRDRVPVTPTQVQACIAGELAEGLPYQFNAIVHFTGALDVGALELALTTLVARHDILHTRFPKRRGTWWHVVEPPFEVRLPVVDVRTHDDPEAELGRIVSDAFTTRLDIEQLPLVRWVLVRTRDDRWVLVHVEHHLIHDGWSWSIFLRELAAVYRAAVSGSTAALPDAPVQFRDFAHWQTELIRGEIGREQLEYWTRRLAHLPPPLQLPTDRPRPMQPSYRGDQLVQQVAPELLERLRSTGMTHGVTLFMSMFAAFMVALSRYSGEPDVVVGSGVANRRAPRTDDLFGMVLNTVALRTDLSDDPPVSELLRRVRDVALDALAHQDVPFPCVLDALAPERHPGFAPVYQVLFSFQDPPAVDLTLPGVVMTPDDSPGNRSAKADLNVVVVRSRTAPDGEAAVTIIWEYSTDLFDATTAGRMLDSYCVLLDAMASDPDQRVSELPLVSSRERARLIETSRAPTRYERDASIVDVFGARVRETPDAIALLSGDAEKMSYEELHRRANQLARRLQRYGVVRETPVAVLMDRSPNVIVTLLAILKAGGAYLPLDPGWPEARIAELLHDTGARLVCTESRLETRLPESATPLCIDCVDVSDEPDDDVRVPIGATDLAYISYTSGSTGAPKGVEVPHRAVVRLVRGVDYVNLTPSETLLALAPLAFDASTFEIWGALLNGARLAIAPARPQAPADVAELLQRYHVSTLWLTAGLFHQLVERAGAALGGLRQLLAGGDVLSPSHVAKALELLPPDGTLVNGYGPTEATTFTCCHCMPARSPAPDPVPIGTPIANTYVYVLDARGELVPPGVRGELYIGGDGLARGYRGRSDLTRERFVADRFRGQPGERLYRSGDLVRRRHDGILEFLGRVDRQVKIRGFRVEPEAIEHSILAHPAVREAAVVARHYGTDDTRLVAYVAMYDTPVRVDDVRAWLADRLPVAELPAAWVTLPTLPLTANGKVDRDALPEPAVTQPDEPDDADHAARVPDRLHRRMLEIWEQVLSVSPVHLDDDFFDLGGHSLLAVDLFARIERDIGPRLPLATIFEAPTPEELIETIRREGWEAPWNPLVALNTRGDRPPLFLAAAGDGNTVGYGALARHLPPDQPFYGLQPSGLDGRTLLRTRVPAMARRYLRAIREVQPHGPYLLGGRCLGGLVAYEMARILEGQGETVRLLAILDSLGPYWEPRLLPNGVPFDEVMNLALRHAPSEGFAPVDVFTDAGADRFLDWLGEPAVSVNGVTVNRYLYEAYRARPDVQAVLPLIDGADAPRLVDWGWLSGPREMGMTRSLLLPPTPTAAALRHPRAPRVRAASARAWTRVGDWADVATRGRVTRFASRRLPRLQDVAVSAARAYRAGPYGGSITLVRTREFLDNMEVERWHGVASGGVVERVVSGSHRSMLREPDVASLAQTLQECIDDALGSGDPRGAMAPVPGSHPGP